MRTLTNSAMTVEYPENFVFSGDLNKIRVTKNTTATHVELSFTIDGYPYAENLYFLTSAIEFSMSEILTLIFSRTFNTSFDTVKDFDFTIKLYNNTSLIDTESFSINEVILGKRRVFDKIGTIPNLESFDYSPTLNIDSIYYFFDSDVFVYAVFMDDSFELLGEYIGLSEIDLSGVTGEIKYLIINNSPFDDTFDYTFLYEQKIYLNKSLDCSESIKKIGLRFLNRFGLWRSYEVMMRQENIASSSGISIWFLEGNNTELNNLFSDQKKDYSQSVTIYREGVDKNTLNDFSDVIYSEKVHVYDENNASWIPVKIQTSSFGIDQKENLFDVSLNILLQNSNG